MRTAELGIAAAILALGATQALAQSCVTTETCGLGGTAAAGGQSLSVSGALGAAIGGPFGMRRDGFSEGTVAAVGIHLSDTSLAGAFIGTDDAYQATDPAGSPVAPGFRVGGLYFAHQYGDRTILQFYAGGRASGYEDGGATPGGQRYVAGLDVSRTLDRGGRSVFVPFGKIAVARDNVPSESVLGTTVTAGGRWEYKDPVAGTGLLPYVSLGLDYVYSDPGGGQQASQNWGPRVEAGVAGAVGAGKLSLDLHAAPADQGTRDVGGALTYSFGF